MSLQLTGGGSIHGGRPDASDEKRRLLETIELLYRHSGLANKLSEKAGPEFVVLGNGKGIFVSRLDHHHMRPALSRH